MAKDWIAGATKNKGALHRALDIKPGEKIPIRMLDKASHSSGKLGKEARLAETLRNLRAKGD